MIYFDNCPYPVDFVHFPAGEVHTNVFSGMDPESLLKAICIDPPIETVTAVLRHSDDIMQLLLVTDALKRCRMNGIAGLKLSVPYFPYARQDRITSPGEPLSVRVMADLVNSLGYHSVHIVHPHSDVTPVLLDSCQVTSGFIGVQQALADILTNGPLMPVTLVAPDAGAEKYVRHCAEHLKLDMVTGGKVRDTRTGGLSDFKVHADTLRADRFYLICDDICDGGGTFIGLADEMRRLGAKHIGLVVSHGIFSKTLSVFDGVLDRVFYLNTFKQSRDRHVTHLHIHNPEPEVKHLFGVSAA